MLLWVGYEPVSFRLLTLFHQRLSILVYFINPFSPGKIEKHDF